MEAIYRAVDGVVETEVGFTGGEIPNVTYEQVCGGATGHAEAVHLRFDPLRVTYGEILQIFWASIDPTEVDRQGPDVGEQYRSAIFFHTPEQETVALASLAELDASGKWSRPIATAILPAEPFWPADAQHQQYYERKGLLDSFFAARKGAGRGN